MYSIDNLDLVLLIPDLTNFSISVLVHPGRRFTELILLRVQKHLPEMNRYSNISQVLGTLKQ